MTKGGQGRFLLLYGSQTGQAKAIAEEIFETSPQHGLDPEMHCFSVTDKKFCIENEKCVVIVVSTTGEGEPPDTATKFWRRIKKKTLPSDHLAAVGFTLLGLGDSNYTNFCCNGKNFDKRLQELGACHFYPPGFADDATGLEIVAEPWIEGLYPALCKQLGLENISASHIENATNLDHSQRAESDQRVKGNKDLDSNLKSLKAVDEIVKAVSQMNVSPSSDIIQSRDVDPSKDVGPSKNEGLEKIRGLSNPDGPFNDASQTSNANPATVVSPSTNAKSADLIPASTTNENENENLQSESSRERTADIDSTNQETKITSKTQDNLAKETEKENDSPISKTSTLVSDKLTINQTKTEEQSSVLSKSVVTERAQSGNDASTVEQQTAPSEQRASATISDCPSLRRSVPPLSESGLTLPLLPPSFLETEFHVDQSVNIDEFPLQGGAQMPSASSPVTMATLSSATKLTRDDAVKTALDVELDITGSGMLYQPGDSFSIICPNNDKEVVDLIQRLGHQDKADCPLSLKVISGTKKRRAAVPEYLPQPMCTLRHALQHCCDIRNPPKKAFLRVLVEHTDDESEKRRLQELCSKQGAADYGAFIRDPHLSLSDILTTFPSCNPPLSRVFEHLTRLQPRPYSISSSPLVDPGRLHFVFNVVVFLEGEGREKKRDGVCTGWLSHMTIGKEQNTDSSTAGQTSNLDSTDSLHQIPVFQRNNQHFHLPSDPATPIIMIGPGTGVAPFVGFLDHRACLKKTGASLGPAWLFFGCRHKERDFLYRDALEDHLSAGVLTKLSLSFSRDPVPPESSHDAERYPVPRYVQDNLKLNATELCRLILENKAVIYVCGDARHMAKNVTETLSSIFIKETGSNAYEAANLLASLREEKRYLEDVWT